MKIGNLVKDAGGVALYAMGPAVVGRMPREYLVRQASFLGDRVRHLSRRDARRMGEELTATFPDLDPAVSPREWVRRAYRLRMLQELEVLRYPELSPENIDQTAVIDGVEHLEAALDAGRGAVLMIGHFGANQMIMPALGHRGYKVHQLSAPPTAWAEIRVDERVNRLWEVVQRNRWALEQALPVQHIDVFGFLRPAYRALERNEVLGLAFDGGGGRRWMEVGLGARRAMISEAPWQLARTSQATVLPTLVRWDPAARVHRVELQPGFTVAQSADRRADLRQAAERYLGWFERQVRAAPDHYAPFLLLRWRVRNSDDQPFFRDYL
ncbi:MAG: lauroyl acyltransferase [Deltaproteobacteria bacterium]|nr:lauroyl acyltransferase [Deltaproteobacteria bacterium]